MNADELIRARDVATLAADAAEATITEHLNTGDWQVQYKADDSPVTEVDIATEHAIRAVLAKHFPDTAFYGEETGQSQSLGEHTENANSNVLWLVDPIDGTKSFIRNMRFYSTQIALQVNGELLAGVSNAPAFGES